MDTETTIETLTLPPPPGLSVETFAGNAVVLSFPVPDSTGRTARLTAAERAIAEGLLSGLTNFQLALRRGVSKHTIANQVAAIFAKLKVRSRLDLALLIRNEASV